MPVITTWMRYSGAAAIALALAACNQSSAAKPASATDAVAAAPAAKSESAVDRGKYLVSVIGCDDCHTPKTFGPNGPMPDMSRRLSGHSEKDPAAKAFVPAKGSPWAYAATPDMTAWSGPWGVSFAANLTPDMNTGLRSGVWSEDVFIKAIRTGKHMGTSRDILPPMPVQDLRNLSDDDLKAIWAYLGTIPPVVNHVPDPVPPGAHATH